jgi:2-C-methyl-D-erythritol 4-phosphate cytidylyltransferase
MNVAVILAGGTGERVGPGVPKQLIKIAGKTILEHTLDTFESHPDIDEILIVMAAGFTAAAEGLVASGGYRKVVRVLEGGAERSESTSKAIDALNARGQPAADCNVIFHDAVRPLVEPRVITQCIAALGTYAAVDVAIPSSDTVIMVDDADIITSIPPRGCLRRGQTPQAFRLPVIRRAYALAREDPGFATNPVTDDCGVVLRYLPDTPIYVVPGSEHNIKVTHPLDLHIADKLFQLASRESPPPAAPETYRQRLAGRTLVVLAVTASARMSARSAGAMAHRVFSFSVPDRHARRARAEVAAALRQAHDTTGRIDFVVNTAGVLQRGNLADIQPAAIEDTIRVNYLAPAVIAQAAMGYLGATQGHLLLYTSSSYTRGRAGYALYSSAKAAVVNLTQALADEWSASGIKVNCMNPERTRTPMRLRAFGAEPPDTLLTSMAVARTSIDILVSDLTGHVIDVRLVDPLAAAASRGSPDDRLAPPAAASQRVSASAPG